VPPRRVLVVDDNLDAAEGLAMLLSLRGHQVATAYDGQSALERARQLDPDVVLLDIGLPRLDGFEVARRLREEHAGKPMVLVALTGYGQERDRVRAREAGFDHHFLKPVRLEMLERLLTVEQRA
jgi:CheY-like chemotaxis protein